MKNEKLKSGAALLFRDKVRGEIIQNEKIKSGGTRYKRAPVRVVCMVGVDARSRTISPIPGS